MKKFLLGLLIGFFLGWVSLRLFVTKTTFYPAYFSIDFLDDNNPRSYKDYLGQMLYWMRQMNEHLEQIELNTKAVKEKLHA